MAISTTGEAPMTTQTEATALLREVKEWMRRAPNCFELCKECDCGKAGLFVRIDNLSRAESKEQPNVAPQVASKEDSPAQEPLEQDRKCLGPVGAAPAQSADPRTLAEFTRATEIPAQSAGGLTLTPVEIENIRNNLDRPIDGPHRRQVINAICDMALRSAPAPEVVALADWISRVQLDIAELPDRDSPDDWPEAMLVTGDELRRIIERHMPITITVDATQFLGGDAATPFSDAAMLADEAKRFHELYEQLAPQFGYVTRTDTRKFDPESANGRLMIAVIAALRRR